MSDKKNDYEEDYQYPSDDYEQPVQMHDEDHGDNDASEHAVQQSGFISKIQPAMAALKVQYRKRPRVFIVVAAIIVLLLLIHVFSGGSSSQSSAAQATPVNQKPTMPVEQRPSPGVVALTKHVSALKQAAAANQAAIASLSAQMQGIQAQLSQIVATEKGLNHSLIAMANQRAVSHKAAAASTTTASAAPMIVPLHYHLRAIVTGRAWVTDSNGVDTTVVVGQHLPQMGVVKSIEPNQGLVYTSSGKVIRFEGN